MHPEGRVVGFEKGALRYEAPSGIPRGSDESEGQSVDRLREKRALGLLLSGLAQIFGYSVTPVQLASLPNSTMRPAAMSPAGNATKQQVASSRPASANATMPPRQQETIRFTGVVNFGNNSDILGHLQRYERIFHGGGGNTTTTPKPTPMSAANFSVDPRPSKAPLLAPFFVKIPLPIAPNLPPATMPIGDFKLSYPVPLISVVSGSSEGVEAEAPVRKEQETVYRNNKNTEQYTLEEKDIYDEKDVSKPPEQYNRESYVGDPRYNEDDRYDNVQRKQQEHAERLKQQEDQRDRDRDAHYREDEIDERHKNREKEIANRNREHASKHQPKEEKRPAHDEDDEEEEEDGNSAEKHEEDASRANESSKEPMKADQRDKSEEDYSDRDDADKPFDPYKYPNFDKYVEAGYDRDLPIGDYFHESNPEVIRDSYGEVLDNKKLQDDRLSGYFSMFKQPHTDVGESQEVRNSEDASSKEDEGRASVAQSDYGEHLNKLQKLRDEYALPESKYEEYDVNDERGGDREDRKSERSRNRTSERSKDAGRARAPTEGGRAEVPARFEDADSREEIDLARYMPLIVPVRYVDANDKLREETTRRGSNEDEPARNRFPEGNVDAAASREKLALPIGLPERSRQLYEDERKGLQLWPSPFDYVFDNTEPVNTVVLPNHQRVRSLAASSSNDNSSEPSSDYVVVVSSPYGEPYELYYFPNEAADQNPHSDIKNASSRVHVAQASPDATGRSLSETARHFRDHRPRGTPIEHLDRYRYVFEERTSQDQTPQSPDANKNARSQVIDAENQSGTHRVRDQATKRSPPIAARSRDASFSNYPRAQDKSPERPRYSPASRRKLNTSRPEGQRENGGRTDPSSSRRRSKPGNPQSTRDSLEKAGNSFTNVSRVTEVKAKAAGDFSASAAPEVAAYRRNESADATRAQRKKRKPTSGSTGARSRP